MKLGLLALLLVFSSACAAEEIYRDVAPDGSVRYTDRQPHKRARPIQLAPLSGITPGGTAQRTFYSPEALRAAARFAVSVESPTPGQVFRAGGDRMVAAASVMPGLVAGFRLIYLLDGHAITDQAVEDMSVLLPSPTPGEHHVSIIVLDPAGREVARSAETPFRVTAP